MNDRKAPTGRGDTPDANSVLPIVIMGTGANSREVKSIIAAINACNDHATYDVLGFAAQSMSSKSIGASPVVCDDDSFERFAASRKRLGVVIPIADPAVKKQVFERIKHIPNLVFPNIIHPNACFKAEGDQRLGKGCVIEAGVVVAINVNLADFVYLNYSCTIGHDTIIGSFSTVNPMAAISGDVKIGEQCLIGAGAAIKQGLQIGKKAVLGLGAFVVKPVPANAVMVCDPAKPMD